MANNLTKQLDSNPNQYIVNSNNIKVFPTAYRAEGFNIESRLHTETNFTSHLPIEAGRTYVKHWGKLGDTVNANPEPIQFFINGYYFEIKDIDNSNLLTATTLIAFIEVGEDELSDGTTTGKLNSFANVQTELTETPVGDNILDYKDSGGDYWFAGLILCTSDNQADWPETKTHSLILRKDSKLYSASEPLHIRNSETSSSNVIGGLVLNAFENEIAKNVASGNYSLASGYLTQAIGDHSHAEGLETHADGNQAHAEGYDTHANTNAHAEGLGTDASGERSHAEGSDTTAQGKASHAEGQGGVTYGEASHVEGYNTQTGDSEDSTKGTYAHAEGEETTASGRTSHAEGIGTIASGGASHAEGAGTTASEQSAHAEGHNTVASEINAHAEGEETAASGKGSHAEGIGTITNGQGAHAEGYYTTAYGKYSHAEGVGVISTDISSIIGIAKGEASHSEGKNTIAQGFASHAENYFAKALGDYSHAEGGGSDIIESYDDTDETRRTEATGNFSHAEGFKTHAYGAISHSEGNQANATGDYSHAEGFKTSASKEASHAEGYGTKASNAYAHAEGYMTTVSSVAAHAEGSNTEASGTDYFIVTGINYYARHAEGNLTKATKTGSHAEGNSTRASGAGSHAEGSGTTASGDYSHAEGQITVANHLAQHVFGEFNIVDDSTAVATARGKYVEIVGNGNISSLSNARTLDWDGNEWLAGTLAVNGSYINLKCLTSGDETGNAFITFTDNAGHTHPLLWGISGTSQQAYGCGAMLCGYGATAVYAGDRLTQNKSDIISNWSNEVLFMMSDQQAEIITNCDNGLNGAYTWNFGSDGNLNCPGQVKANSFYAQSDARLKENIGPYISQGSILELPIYKYDFINGAKNQIGCLAQDLQKICPEIVHEGTDGYLSIEEGKLVYLLLDEVKKLKTEIDSLKNGK